MASERYHNAMYAATVALKKGTMMAVSTTYGYVDVATAVTDVPAGILLEDCPAATAANPINVGLGNIEGEVYKVIGSTTIAIKAALGPTTGGKAVTITLSTIYAQEWIWGIALSAAGAGGTDLVEMRYGPQIAS